MTIQAFTQATAHYFGDALSEQGKLRKRFCVDNRGWKQSVAHGMEFDQFDTPDTWYLIYRDDGGRVWACNRLIPTTAPYMIEKLWPDMVTAVPIVKSTDIWEQSRFCIDDDLPKKMKGTVIREMLGGQLEFNQVMGISATWWMAEPKNVEFIKDDVDRLGPNKVVDGRECFVGQSMAQASEKLEFVQWAPDEANTVIAAE